MKTKENNNLILITENNKKIYFTSSHRAGNYLGVQGNSVNWAIVHNNKLKNKNNEEVKIELVDGSEIPYKLINN